MNQESDQRKDQGGQAGKTVHWLKDDANPDAPPLKVEVIVSRSGITVQALNDHGQPLGDVHLDYFDDAVKGLVTVGWDAEPCLTQVIVERLAAVRRTDLRHDG